MSTFLQDLLRPTILSNLFLSLLTVLIIWWLRRVVLRIAHQRFDDPVARYQWQKNSTYLAIILILLFVGPMWISDFRYAATGMPARLHLFWAAFGWVGNCATGFGDEFFRLDFYYVSSSFPSG